MALPTESPDLRQRIINHTLRIMKLDIDYARAALAHYNTLLPDLKLNDGVRDALKGAK